MMASLDDTEPPGTEIAELDSQHISHDDVTEGSIPGSQEFEPMENDSADQSRSDKRSSAGEQRPRRSRSHRGHSSKHGRNHRKRSRHSKRSSREEVVYDDDSLYSVRDHLNTSGSLAYGNEEAEDGEILEDGEIASDDGDEVPPEMTIRRLGGEIEVRSEDDRSGDDIDIAEQVRESKPRKDKRKRSHKHKDDKKKKVRRHDYIDHDRVDDNNGGRWPSYQGGPDDEYYSSQMNQHENYYYNGVACLPGLYDSPSEESDDDDSANQPSLTSLVSGDFLDANVAASEKEHLKDKGIKSSRERKRGCRGKRKKEGVQHSEPPKKKLVEIPMAERPVCKFYKDGMCAKGSNCPFNHDVLRNKRLECCKFHLMQTGCNKGENCIYMHEDYPCKYFHTGQVCYAAEKCRFSHEPLTEETRKIVDEIISNQNPKEEESQERPKKPSLLGSPPRHVKAALERAKEIKKIPSLFDIEVFPPGQKPKPVNFYSERSDSSSPPPDASPPRPTQTQGPPISSAASPSLLGTPPHNTTRGPNPGGMMQQGSMMGPMNRPMMGPQRPMFGMQQGMNPGMQHGMNSNMQQGMNPNMNPGIMQQGMGPRMQQGMNQGMNTGMDNKINTGMNQNVPNMNQNMQQGMQQGMNQNMQQGINQGMQQGINPNMPQGTKQGLQQGMNPNMPQGSNQGLQQGMNPNMPQGTKQGLQQGMNPNMPQGSNQGLQQGMNPNMPQGSNQGMQQGMNQNMQQGTNQGMQQGMNQNMPQGTNQGMQQGMNQNMPQGTNQGMQQGMNPNMPQGTNQGMQQGMNPNMPQGTNQGMQHGMNPNMPQGTNQGMQQGMNQNIQIMNQNMQQSIHLQQGVNQNMQQGINPVTQQRMQNPGMPQAVNTGMMQQGMNPNMQPGISMNQQGMNPMQGMNPNMRCMNPNMMQGMNRMMNPNMAGMAAARFGMGAQTASSMPPVFNMISALLRGASGNGPFNQNGQGPVPNQGPPGSQDPDKRPLSDSVMQDGSEMSEQDKVPGNTQDITAEHSAVDVGSDSDVGSSLIINEDKAEEALSISRNKGSSPQYGEDTKDDEGSQTIKRENSNEETSLSDQELSPGNKDKIEGDADSGVMNTTEKDDSLGIAMQLPPKQRQLFMRLRQQQLNHDQQQLLKEDAMESEESHTAEEKPAEKESVEDDDWYSSDEEENCLSKKKLTDILKTVQAVTNCTGSVTTTPMSASVASSSSASTINVMQMIQSIRSQAQTSQPSISAAKDSDASSSAQSETNEPKAPHQKQTDLHSIESGSQIPPSTPLSSSEIVTPPVLPTMFVDPPVINGVLRRTVVYRMTPLSVRAVKPYWSLPSSVDIDNEDMKKDPRVQAHLSLVEKRGPEPKGAPPPTKISDPRLSRKGNIEEGSSSSRPQDPRMRGSCGKDPRLAIQDPHSQKMVPQDPTGQNPSHQEPRMLNAPGQGPWMGGNMGGGGMMGPDARMMNAGGGMNMMQGPNNMGTSFQGNMMQGPRGMMPGQGDVWNGPIRMGMSMNMQQGPMGMQQGPMGMQQGPLGVQQGHMGMHQGHLNMQGGPMGINQGLLNNMQGGMMNMQGPMGMKDPRRGPMNMQGGPMGMQGGPMGMQGGPVGMQQSNMGIQGPMGMQQGNMGMQHGNMGMQQNNSMQHGAMATQMEVNQNPLGTSDPRQNSMQRPPSDPRQRGVFGNGDPREGRSSALDPRRSHAGRNSPQSTQLGTSSQPNLKDSSHMSPSEFSSLSDPSDSAGSFGHNSVNKSSESQPGMGSFSIPSPLRELPTKPKPDISEDGSTSEEGVTVKRNFDHRNDPRFKRKRASEKSENCDVPVETALDKSRKVMGQRKSSMEYASPLGCRDDVGSSESGYNSYNRPPQGRQDPRKKKTVSDNEKLFELPQMPLPPLLSNKPPPLPKDMTPSGLVPDEPKQQLKDLFKTFDPTASPFC